MGLSAVVLAACSSTKQAPNTTTHLRCYYKLSSDPTDPRTSNFIAEQGGDRYALQGYWRHPNLPGLNLFYTDIPRARIEQICADTLQAHGIAPGSTFTFLSAAPTVNSLDYEVWHNSATLPPTGDIDRIVVFGDSLSDVNNVFNLTKDLVLPIHGEIIKGPAPNSTSWLRGRFSSGPLWHETLSGAANIPSHNWALGGAMIDQRYFPALLEQIASYRDYIAHTKNYNIENTLFAIFFGSNDLLFGKRDIDEVLDAFKSDLELLTDTEINGKRVKHILLVNLPDLSKLPRVQRNPEKAARIRQEVKTFNTTLPEIVNEVAKRYRARYGHDLNIQTYNIFDTLNDIYDNPGTHGIVNVTDNCLIIDPAESGAKAYTTAHDVADECRRSQGGYLFWDGLHPTGKVHGILGKAANDLARQHFPLPR